MLLIQCQTRTLRLTVKKKNVVHSCRVQDLHPLRWDAPRYVNLHSSSLKHDIKFKSSLWTEKDGNNRLLQLRLLEPPRRKVENYTPIQEVLVVVRMRGAFNPARERSCRVQSQWLPPLSG